MLFVATSVFAQDIYSEEYCWSIVKIRKRDKKSCNPAKLIKIRTARTEQHLATGDGPISSTQQMAFMEIKV
jgi:murein L,D-transpeptidase YafK